MAKAPSPFSDDVECDDDEDFVFYSQRPEWADIKPIPESLTPKSILVIQNSQKFTDCFNYLRAVMKRGEKSYRVLELTADAISCNAANYTVWQYRREVLQALEIPCQMTKDGLSNKEFEEEFDFSRDMIDQNQKNYQVWHHRKILVTWAAGYFDESVKLKVESLEAKNKLLDQELTLTHQFLNKDSKNYHAWQHRQWVLNAFDAFEFEMTFVETLLDEDVRNNSAWNQRYFVLTKLGDFSAEVINKEIDYSWKQILKATSNESPWSYLEGIFRLSEEVTLGGDEKILKLCEDLYAQKVESVPMLSFMLTAYEERLSINKSPVESYEMAIKICGHLENDIDKIRCSYWTYIRDKFETKYKELNS